MSELRRIEKADGGPAPAGAYSQAVVIDKTVYAAGQVAVNAAGELVGENDFLAQARQVYSNLQAVLEAAGSDLSRVAKLNVYLTDAANLADQGRVRKEFMREGEYPASTLVQIVKLADPRWLIEIEAVAYAG